MDTLLLAAAEGFKWHDLAVQLIGFVILAVILWKLVFPPVGRLLDQRSRGIEEQFTKLDRDLMETASKVEEFRRRLAEIGQETRNRLEAAQHEAARARDALMAEAQAQSQAEFEKARREVQMESDKAVLELRQAVTDLTVAATEKVIDGLMDEPLHRKLVENYLGNLEQAIRQT